MKIPKIKMLILDVDGTMTDNGIYIDENGIESKKYNAKDGVGIYELLKKNIIIGIISHSEKGDGIISRANYLGIQYCYVGNDQKDKILYEWIEKEKIDLHEYLRKSLENDAIEVITKIQKTTKEFIPYTNKDKYEQMAKDNPSLNTLREKLGLDFDY